MTGKVGTMQKTDLSKGVGGQARRSALQRINLQAGMMDNDEMIDMLSGLMGGRGRAKLGTSLLRARTSNKRGGGASSTQKQIEKDMLAQHEKDVLERDAEIERLGGIVDEHTTSLADKDALIADLKLQLDNITVTPEPDPGDAPEEPVAPPEEPVIEPTI